VQTPQYRIDSFDALQRTPVTPANASSTQLLWNLGRLQRITSAALVNHYNVQPVFDIYANADQRDLGSVASAIQKILDSYEATLNVPSLMGSMMAIGVATANSILLVVFANDERAAGKDALQASLSAGLTRIRPVIMTALAMIIGMAPMALSLGEGGEQNAPLGRAVIGGLLLATFSTLFFVPAMYSVLRKGEARDVAPSAIIGEPHVA